MRSDNASEEAKFIVPLNSAGIESACCVTMLVPLYWSPGAILMIIRPLRAGLLALRSAFAFWFEFLADIDGCSRNAHGIISEVLLAGVG